MKLNQLTIGVRLGAAFGLVVLVTALVALVAMIRVESLKVAAEHAAVHILKREVIANQWAADIGLNAVRAVAIFHSSAGDARYVTELQREMKTTSAAITEGSATMKEESVDPAARKLLDDVFRNREIHSAKLQELLVAKLAGTDVSARVDTELTPVSKAYRQSLAALVAEMREQGLERQESTLTLARNSQWLIALGGLIAVLLGSLSALLVSRSISRPVLEAAKMAEAIADGDLANQRVDTGRDEIAQLLRTLSSMRAKLASIVGDVRSNAEVVATASAEIASDNNELSTRTEQQASALEETAASMEELSSTVKQNAENSHQASELARRASAVALRGGEVVNKVVETMKEINGSSKRIADIISVIDGIAFQTNILALNAAVEAARAGEQGRGFAVVASEVRSLAQRSAEAAKEISALITVSVERVEAGTALVDQAGSTMQQIVESIRGVSDIVGEISAASKEQSLGVSQVGEAVTQMDQATQQNAALVEASAAAAATLKEQADQLVRSVSVFRVDSRSEPSGPVAAPRPAPRFAKVPAKPTRSNAPAVRTRAPTAPRVQPRSKVAVAADSAGDWENF